MPGVAHRVRSGRVAGKYGDAGRRRGKRCDMPSAEDADRPGDHPALDALRELPPTSLFVFDAALDLQRYHAAAPHHVLGEVAGEPVEDGSAGLLDEEVYALLRKAQEEDRMQTRAVVSRATSGEERALTLAAHPLRDPDGGPGGVAAQIADLSGERHDYGRLDTLVEEEALIDRSLNVADTAQRLVDMMAARRPTPPRWTSSTAFCAGSCPGTPPSARRASSGGSARARTRASGCRWRSPSAVGTATRTAGRSPAPSPTTGRMSPSWAVTTTGGCPAWSSGSWRPPERTR